MNIKPDFIFETSWEICNKIGGIYTVISTKAKSIVEEYKDNYILIGPDVWKETTDNPDFVEDASLFEEWKEIAWKEGLKVRTGRWNIEGKPLVILVDFTPFFLIKMKFLSISGKHISLIHFMVNGIILNQLYLDMLPEK